MQGILKLISVLIPVICMYHPADAQCTGPISSFPYAEGFELSASWTTGGNFSDWTWGAPSKATISSAGQGNKCWITGGLTGNSYNDNESAWLQSPCFNLSSLSNPRISFLVFWETERRYDGATFQYSVNGGTTWITLGNENSNSDCRGTEWYNFSPINFLGGQPGWSGNIQPTSGSCLGGNGSNGWVQARHSLAGIPGSNQILFRFLFAAGATCNQYNGFAVDNVIIDDTPPAGAVDFTSVCTGTASRSFSNLSTLCRSSVSWDFGDIASGSSNAASGDTVSHNFSAPGEYEVTMTVTFTNGQTASEIKYFTVLGANAAVTQPLLCNGDDDGAAAVNVTGGTGPYFYSWSTNPPQSTATVSGLPAGTYTVNVSAANACNASSVITITDPGPVTPAPSVINEICGNAQGSITLNVSGGSAPFSYQWNNGSSASSLTALSAGTYSVSVTDDNGCTGSADNILVSDINNPVSVNLGKDTFICNNQTLELNPGSFSFYLWQDGSASSTFTVSATGIYYVTVRDANNCIGSDTIRVTADCSDIYFPSAFSPDGDGLNETFGPLGNLGLVSNYSLRIFNRYGQIIFETNNPLEKWDGRSGKKTGDVQAFVWMTRYSLNNKKPFVRKGTLLLVR